MAKSILTVGLDLASPDTRHENFRSRVSLLDWDIVLFRPLIGEFWDAYVDHYQGKPSLDDSSSFQLKEASEHWRREIKQAVETGKTVFVFLPEVQEVYIDTGKRRYSGTGRNQKTTHIVAPYTNYATIPAELGPVNATGTAMKLVPLGAEVLAPYWSEFASVSQYKVVLTGETVKPCIATKNGDKAVATLLRSETSSGSLVLLPDIDFDPDAFYESRANELDWTPAAEQFAAKLVGALVALDRVLHASADVTPEPEWSNAHRYSLRPERILRAQLLETERQVEEAQRKLEDTKAALHSAGRLRALLYEKGRPLENAIVDALIKIGFSAAPYKDTQSEFDVVFQCAEGRLLGEAEGKDTKAVNVDKLRQLAMNIHEDLQREEVLTPAKGVLFGNGFRLTPPQDREHQFTTKCISAAVSSSTALIPTSELFRVAQYIAESNDDVFASDCRHAILKGVGITNLPATPVPEEPDSEESGN